MIIVDSNDKVIQSTKTMFSNVVVQQWLENFLNRRASHDFTMESEFITLDKVTEKAEWLCQFLEHILRWSKPMPAITIYCDSQSAIDKA